MALGTQIGGMNLHDKEKLLSVAFNSADLTATGPP